MNRQIKFRGKWLYGDKEWVYGGIVSNEGHASITTYDSMMEIDPSTLCQFTGLLDRNGKEIYEGDIITVRGNFPRIVLWDKVSWALMPCELYNDKHFWIMNLQHPGNDWWEGFADEMEVVGNMYDNPELLNPIKLE